MPIYEYSCKKCGKTIEVIQKFSDPVMKKHQGCGGSLTKLVSASSFHLKGTGWYVTDYARKGKGGESEGSASSADSKSNKESPSKSETASKESSKESTKATPKESSKKPAKSSGKSSE
jgi:putative FmdB family regulatory protein